MDWESGSMGEWLLSKHKAMSSNPGTTSRQKKKKTLIKRLHKNVYLLRYTGGMAQVVEHLPSKLEIRSSSSSTERGKEERGKGKRKRKEHRGGAFPFLHNHVM
jgi:hypothetical protein